MTGRRFRDHRAVHIEADRRRPFAVVNPRAPEVARRSASRACLMMLLGLIVGALITWALTGRVC
ncbi:hypothetical protein HZY97_20325 [Sphingomonas sp. R-74633]|uniref:hypothetical protein n=1 Tax=Sphingomonas sp. R-74633 TaxID=2751188 RepID=UPI0015D3B0B5|nr:hypothetical protein [Sphingomonas sp. R-74633]NYT43133.1 hypothetical protein [Sphingomonas sp. R-74633]